MMLEKLTHVSITQLLLLKNGHEPDFQRFLRPLGRVRSCVQKPLSPVVSKAPCSQTEMIIYHVVTISQLGQSWTSGRIPRLSFWTECLNYSESQFVPPSWQTASSSNNIYWPAPCTGHTTGSIDCKPSEHRLFLTLCSGQQLEISNQE